MRLFTVLSLSLACATPLVAGTQSAVSDHILPGYVAFSQAAIAQHDAAQVDCTPASVMPAYHAAYDAWISISHVHFGPVEADGTALALSFWPDPKDNTGKSIARLMADADAAVLDPAAFKEVSIAAQGFLALERLMSEPQSDAAYACALTQAMTGFIAGTATALLAEWQGEYAGAFAQARTASHLTSQDTRRALYTALSTSLAFVHDQRLGRPLGTFDRPRPNRAEARRTTRSQRHILLTLIALKDLTATGFDEVMTPELSTAFDTAIERAKTLNDPDLSGVADQAKRFKVEVLQRAVRDVQVLVADQIAGALNITAGFNSLDGD